MTITVIGATASTRGSERPQEADMFLATTTVEDYERFERIFYPPRPYHKASA